MRIKALDNYLHHSESVADGVGRAFKVMSDKNKIALGDFGAMGEKVSTSFGSHMSSAFKDIGSGAKSATDALGGAFKGMVGDMASQYGEMEFLASIWPPNPAGLAAGAALMTLGGFLSGSGGGSSASGIDTSGGSSSGASSSVSSTDSGLSANAAQTTPQKSTTLVINGPIMNNDQTARWLTDAVRRASDSSAFTIQATNNAGNNFGG
jgi:hypothetical protein